MSSYTQEPVVDKLLPDETNAVQSTRVRHTSANIETPRPPTERPPTDDRLCAESGMMFAMSPSDDPLEHLSGVDDENNSFYDDGYGRSPAREGRSIDVDRSYGAGGPSRRSDSDYSSITTDSPASFLGSTRFTWETRLSTQCESGAIGNITNDDLNRQHDDDLMEEEMFVEITDNYSDEDDDDVFDDAPDGPPPFASYQTTDTVGDLDPGDQVDGLGDVDRPTSVATSSGSSGGSHVTVMERRTPSPSADQPTQPMSIPPPLHQSPDRSDLAYDVSSSRLYGTSPRRLSGSFVGFMAHETSTPVPTYGDRLQRSVLMRRVVRAAQDLPESRPRVHSESGHALVTSSSNRNRIQSEPQATSRGRDRTQSAPSFCSGMVREVGQELRRISDEFHVDFINGRVHPPSQHNMRNGTRAIHESRSFPNTNSTGNVMWQQFLNMLNSLSRANSQEYCRRSDSSDEVDCDVDCDEVDGLLLDHDHNLYQDDDFFENPPRRQRSHTDGDIMPWSQVEELLQRQYAMEHSGRPHAAERAHVRRQDSLDSQGYDFVAGLDQS